jgi:hypothetical protein
LSGDLEETIGVNLEGGDELSLATGHRRNASKFKFAEQTVVTALGTFTFVALGKINKPRITEEKECNIHREGNSRLVVLDSGECPGLVGGDGRVAGNDDTKDVTLHGNTEGERGNIEKEEILGLVGGLTGKDGSLDGGTVGDSLIGVNGFVQLASTEVLRNEGLDLGDTSGTTNQDDVVNLLTGHLGILEDLLDRFEGRLEHGGVDLLETRTSDICREVLTLEE